MVLSNPYEKDRCNIMINPPEKQLIPTPEDVLNECIEGLHIYSFDPVPRLEWVSDSFCRMVGYDRAELPEDEEDSYIKLIHPEDRDRYRAFLLSFCGENVSACLKYRLMHKDGSFIHVNDTMHLRIMEDGSPAGFSVLSDITDIVTENTNLHFLNETIPCGFIQYTCGDQPEVTFINDRMLRMLHYSEDGDNVFFEQCRKNIFLMLPIEERVGFSHFLSRVDGSDGPVAGELTVMRFDGSRARLYGWIGRTRVGDEDYYQCVCMDITERYMRKKNQMEQRYIHALSQIYSEIFSFDFTNRTLRCIHGQDSVYMIPEGIPMVLEEAAQYWLNNMVAEEDRPGVSSVLRQLHQRARADIDGKPLNIEFNTTASGGVSSRYQGIFLKLSTGVYLLCCRNLSPQMEAEKLKHENSMLRNVNEHMQELVMRFTDGMLGFEVTNGMVRPLYISENVCRFFGYTREEWLPMMQRKQSLGEFVSKSGIAYSDFARLLENKEAEFDFTGDNGEQRRIKAICTTDEGDNDAPTYVMLYDITVDSLPVTPVDSAVYIRTFGYFDVFVDGKPIAFRNEKSKELFALLVDRRGGFVSSGEAISYLWENEPANSVTLARYRKVALRLKNLLEEYGIADIVESVDGKRRIVTEKVRCDLYEYLSGDPKTVQQYNGSYLLNYSWGEITAASLNGMTMEEM
ncbi:MAG: PAS domain S-box protein [Ruminococcaceae bacterium]|nr:PAS domain S-box protein [Oscillospiraceae bacterium]